MIQSIAGIVLVLLALFALALQRFYSYVPRHELKRLSQRGDPLALALYRAVAFGTSLRVLLWLVFGLSLGTGLLLIAWGMPSPVAFVLVIAVLVAGFVWLPSARLSVRSAKVASVVAPALAAVLNYVHPVLDLAGRAGNRVRTLPKHSGLFEKEDVLALISQQKKQTDNRLTAEELELVERALQFDDKKAADIALPMPKQRLVSADDTIGPVLLNDLHQSGQAGFLVYKDTPAQVIGTLGLQDAVRAKEGGRVSTLTRHDLVYVHEDFPLRQVAQAFLRTRSQLVVVINAFEDTIGIITLEGLLAQLLGEPSAETLAFEDRALIAAWQPAPVMVTESPNEEPERPPEPTMANDSKPAEA